MPDQRGAHLSREGRGSPPRGEPDKAQRPWNPRNTGPRAAPHDALTPASGTTWGSDSGLWGVSKPHLHNGKPYFQEEGLREGLGAQVRAPAFRSRHSKSKH